MKTLPVQYLNEGYNERTAADVWTVVQRAQAGDTEAFGQLYRRYHLHIFRFIKHRIRDIDLVEDLTADTFVRALRSIHRYQQLPGVDFGAWLSAIARNAVCSYLRLSRVRHEVAVADMLDVDFFDPCAPVDEVAIEAVESIETRRRGRLVVAALGCLTGAQREAVTYRMLRGYSLEETAAAMSKGVDAVKGLQQRGISRLREVTAGVLS